MNVPKTPDYKLIGALRALANDNVTIDVENALLKAADRLAELTQPQPIETAPLMYHVKAFGGMIVDENGIELCPNDNRGVVVSTLDNNKKIWSLFMSTHDLIKPTHWLPCLKVDPASLGLTGQRSK